MPIKPEYLALEPGDELNRLVMKALGKNPVPYSRRAHNYSGNSNRALSLLEDWVLDWGLTSFSLNLHRGFPKSYWTCDIAGSPWYGRRPDDEWTSHGEGRTIAMAVCHAILDVQQDDSGT
ncbi:MAG: hypothetical protein M0Z94_19730 [Dehalococcoidales bacterium]|nr:hypothetical protein [Dehalococcoidales bacterium]